MAAFYKVSFTQKYQMHPKPCSQRPFHAMVEVVVLCQRREKPVMKVSDSETNGRSIGGEVLEEGGLRFAIRVA